MLLSCWAVPAEARGNSSQDRPRPCTSRWLCFGFGRAGSGSTGAWSPQDTRGLASPTRHRPVSPALEGTSRGDPGVAFLTSSREARPGRGSGVKRLRRLHGGRTLGSACRGPSGPSSLARAPPTRALGGVAAVVLECQNLGAVLGPQHSRAGKQTRDLCSEMTVWSSSKRSSCRPRRRTWGLTTTRGALRSEHRTGGRGDADSKECQRPRGRGLTPGGEKRPGWRGGPEEAALDGRRSPRGGKATWGTRVRPQQSYRTTRRHRKGSYRSHELCTWTR